MKDLIVSIAVSVIVLAAIIIPPYFSPSERALRMELRMLTQGKAYLEKLIEAQDSYFQSNGKYLALDPGQDNASTKQLLKWCIGDCSPCEYGVTVSGDNFTATVRCPLEDGAHDYLGYVRVTPGKQSGIDGAFGKCLAKGIDGGSRFLVNDVGPCFQQESGFMVVASGNKKRLVVETFPGNAAIFANGTPIGKTSGQWRVLSPRYGRFYWSDPYEEPVRLKIAKPGYHSVEFSLEWKSFTYHSVIVLRPSGN